MDASDALKEWIEYSRRVLVACYPGAPFAALVIPMGAGVPDTVLCVTPDPQTPSQTPSSRPA